MELALVDVAFRIAAVLALVAANGFFVAAEFSLVTVRKTRVDQLISEGNRRAYTVRRAISDPEGYIAATQLGITMASIGLGWIGEPALASLIQRALQLSPGNIAEITTHSIAITIAFAAITALHIVLGELAPKTIALQQPEQTSLWVARPTELFMHATWPFIRLLNGMGRSIVRFIGLRPPSGHALVHSEEELKMLVTASQEAGVLEEQEEQMLHRVFGFGDLTAGQVMVPRTEMSALPVNAALEETLAAIAASPHNRLPVYRDTLDDVVGMLHIKDLVPVLAAGGRDFTLGALVREALTVPETMQADELLAEMQRHRTHQAVVIDEYGGTAGFVTFEDLMERIVGEVATETDQRHSRVAMLADGSALLDGLLLVRDVNERFALRIDDETYNTLGGFVLGTLGRRARLGDELEVDGRIMRVEALDGLRVARVFLSAAKPRKA